MGLTIYSRNLSYDLGSGGFYRLRKTIAGLCPDEIKEQYYLLDNFYDIQKKDPGFVKYDMKTEQLYARYRKDYGKVIDFLWASDVEFTLTYGTAGQLLKLIGDYDNDILYGYAGWGEHAMRFHHFKEILQDAYDTKSKWGWR